MLKQDHCWESHLYDIAICGNTGMAWCTSIIRGSYNISSYYFAKSSSITHFIGIRHVVIKYLKPLKHTNHVQCYIKIQLTVRNKNHVIISISLHQFLTKDNELCGSGTIFICPITAYYRSICICICWDNPLLVIFIPTWTFKVNQLS